MFQELTRRLDRTMKKLAGQDRLNEENIAEALREVLTWLDEKALQPIQLVV